MFKLEDNDMFRRAIERARSYKPRVEVIRFGVYRVQATGGDYYDVCCWRAANGDKMVSCSCPTRDDIVCKHGAVAALRHIVFAEERRNQGVK